MEGFFFTSSFYNGEELRELLLRRYHSTNFINEMNIIEFVDFMNVVREKEQEEQIFKQWCACMPPLNKYMGFDEFKEMMTGSYLDMRPTEEIITEIEELHKRAGIN